MSKQEDRRRLLRAYKDETGVAEIDMHEVAEWAVKRGWPLPQPKSPIDILAHEFSEAAREEVGIDSKTGRQYRVYHAVPIVQGQQTLFHWIDIHEAPRKMMQRSLAARRDQMIGDGVQLTFDALFWNSINPDEEPIQMDMNLAPEVSQRVNSRKEKTLFSEKPRMDYRDEHASH
jgi:hypothetical protein